MKKIKCIYLLIAIIALFGFSLGCSSNSSTSSDEPNSESKAEKKNDTALLGEPVTYGDYEVTLKSARASNNGVKEEGRTYLYLEFDVKNLTNEKVMSNAFLTGASLTTADGQQIDGLEIGETPPYHQELEPCWIEPDKYITGEIAFKVDADITDYLFYIDFLTITEDTQIKITSDQINMDATDYLQPAAIGETIKYGDYDVTIKSVRASKEGAKEKNTYLYLLFNVKNNTNEKIMSNIFLMGASLSTSDGMQITPLEPLEEPPYTQELEPCWIEGGKHVTGEVAFQVSEDLTDYLFYMDAVTISENREIAIPAAAIIVE